MVTVCEKDQCAGCMACLEVCSKNAINIKDSIKSYNAIIDEKLCINCMRAETFVRLTIM